jgi:glyoxylase-like metal-dependent hydrolase (beta-lactamase superfamily II)
MMKEYFKFKVWKFDCISLYDGYHDYTIETFFTNVDRRELERALQSRNCPTDRVPSPYTSLYVDTGEHHVLVDTGAGDFFETTGRLSANLVKAGVNPAEIDMVIITHAHPDHIGGLLNEVGRPTYPNARVYTMKKEWDFWLAEDALEKAPGFEESIQLAHKVFDTIGERFSFIQPDSELVPGIQVLAAFGHTPGHIAIEAISSNESVIYLSDAVFHPIHIEHPDWLPDTMFIFDTEQFKEAALRLLTRAFAKDALVIGMHFPPFPSLGRIVETDEGLAWEPVLLSS